MTYWKIKVEMKNSKKNKNRSRPIFAQITFYKGKMNILKNSKKLKNTRFFIFERQLPSRRKMTRNSCQ